MKIEFIYFALFLGYLDDIRTMPLANDGLIKFDLSSDKTSASNDGLIINSIPDENFFELKSNLKIKIPNNVIFDESKVREDDPDIEFEDNKRDSEYEDIKLNSEMIDSSKQNSEENAVEASMVESTYNFNDQTLAKSPSKNDYEAFDVDLIDVNDDTYQQILVSESNIPILVNINFKELLNQNSTS